MIKRHTLRLHSRKQIDQAWHITRLLLSQCACRSFVYSMMLDKALRG